MVNPEDEIRLRLCPKCQGMPVELVRPGWPYPMIRVVCSKCGHTGPGTYFNEKGDVPFDGIERYLLPGLARARREVAAAWNEEPAEHWDQPRGTEE